MSLETKRPKGVRTEWIKCNNFKEFVFHKNNEEN